MMRGLPLSIAIFRVLRRPARGAQGGGTMNIKDYIDGPASEPWEVVENPWSGRNEPIWWLQRRNYSVRENDEYRPYEWRFGMTTDVGEDECHELALRLNELDRLRTLAAAVQKRRFTTQLFGDHIFESEREVFAALDEWEGAKEGEREDEHNT